MASLSNLDFEHEETENEGQLELSFVPGYWSSQPRPWGMGSIGGAFLLTSKHVCSKKHDLESNHLSIHIRV